MSHWRPKKVVVILNGERGLVALSALRATRHSVVAVMHPPGLANSITNRLTELDYLGREVNNFNCAKSIQLIRQLRPDCLLVAGCSTILSEALLGSVPLAINLHGGPVPAYRGGSPLNWQIINGESKIGLSVLEMDNGLDSGPLLASREFAIEEDTTIYEVHERANKFFADAVVEVLDALATGSLSRRAQDDDAATYWHQRSDYDGRIHWASMTARDVHNLVRGLAPPYPGAWTSLEDKTLRILTTRLPRFTVKGSPGRVCRIRGLGTYVVCRDVGIEIVDASLLGAPYKLSNGLSLL